MARRQPPTPPPGPAAALEAERAYATILARLEHLRAGHPPGTHGAGVPAGFARLKRTGAGMAFGVPVRYDRLPDAGVGMA